MGSKRIDANKAFKYVRIIERGLAKFGMREGDNIEDLRFHTWHETMRLYELVSEGGLQDLCNFVRVDLSENAREEIYQAAKALVLTGEESNLSPKSYSAAMERLFKHLVKLCKEFESV